MAHGSGLVARPASQPSLERRRRASSIRSAAVAWSAWWRRVGPHAGARDAWLARSRSLCATSAAALAVVMAFVTPGLSASGTTSSRNSGIPKFPHVFVVVMENLGYPQALDTPGLAHLASRWALATNYYGVAHPSLPNYLALTGGSTFSITSDCVTCYVNAPNLLQQLARAHITYDAYLEGVPGPCYLAPWGGVGFASKHDPFRYYDDVRGSPTLCSHLRPLSELAATLRRPAPSVPRFVWVTPNLCHDGHDCAPGVAASWLNSFVTEVTSSAAWRDGGVLFVTWDEGSDGAGVAPGGKILSSGGGGHVMTLVISPALKRGARIGAALNHYSLLATVEDAFGLPLLVHARGATNFAQLFK